MGEVTRHQQEGGAGLPEYRDEVADEEFWQHARPRREPLDWPWFLPVLLGLLVLNVPWYLPDRWLERLWHGLPVYVWIALASSIALAGLISWSALRHWSDDPEPAPGTGTSREPGD